MNMWPSIVPAVIVSGSGYTDPSRRSFGGESTRNVVVDDTESSMSDVLDGVGELERRGEVLRFLDRIFCVMRV